MELYLQFQVVNPRIIVGMGTFDFFQPYFVKKLKEQNVCCYLYHVEMEELRVAFNNMRTKAGLQ